MDSCACGFETRASPSNSLATTAHFISWNNAILSYVLLISFPYFTFAFETFVLFVIIKYKGAN